MIKQGIFLLSNSWTIYNPIICTFCRDAFKENMTTLPTQMATVRSESINSSGTDVSSVGSLATNRDVQINISQNPTPGAKTDVKQPKTEVPKGTDNSTLPKTNHEEEKPKTEGKRLARKITRMYSSRTESRLRKIFRQNSKNRVEVDNDPVLGAVVQKINESLEESAEKPQEEDKKEKEEENTV